MNELNNISPGGSVNWELTRLKVKLRVKLNKSHPPAHSKLLVVDDEKSLREMLTQSLRQEGYRVLTAAYGAEAIQLACSEQPDLIILDLLLPDLNGFEVCRTLRSKQLTMPIVIISGREDVVDKVLSLELGADDYLTKPFSFRELLARIHAQLRRVEMLRPIDPPEVGVPVEKLEAPLTLKLWQPQSTLVAGDLVIDLAQRTVTYSRQLITMTPKEFDLLAFLALYPQQVFSRPALLENVWGGTFAYTTRTVDVHVRWLRLKLEADPTNPQIIQTVYSVGYKFNQTVAVHTPA